MIEFNQVFMTSENSKKFKAVDLFAGIGGIRLAFSNAGFEIAYSNDKDKYACQTYRENFGEIDCKDIRDVKSDELPEFDVLLAGFPCQPFSMIGKRGGLDDTRGQVFYDIVRILKDRKPVAFFLENVRHILTHNGRETFQHILDELEGAGDGYTVSYEVLNSKDFGLPQKRKRAYIVGIRKPLNEFEFKKVKKYPDSVTLRNFLKLDGSVEERYYLSQKYYDGLSKHKERHQNHPNGSGFGFVVLEPDGMANTLVSGNMGRERNLIKDKIKTKNSAGIRMLTERECAKLQGFNDDFKIPVSRTQAYKQFGNSVSVPVVESIAVAIRETLSNGHS